MENKLLNELNSEISTKLGVSKLNIQYKISTSAKSKFGHCRCINFYTYLINLSSFILGTEMERDTICHELCHAYDHAYVKSQPGNQDLNPHGIAWKMMMEEVFGYKNVKAQGIHNKGIKLIKINSNHYDIYENGNKKAIIKINGKELSIRNNKNEFFENEKNEVYYIEHFLKLR